MYSAREAVENAAYVETLEEAAAALELTPAARTTAVELFLEDVPNLDRSKHAAIAASLYAASRIAGEGRSQQAVADAVGVSRLSVQARWRERLDAAGLEPPGW